MLISVSGTVVPLTQLQSDLYSFFFGIAGMEPVGVGLSLGADPSVASQWRLVRLLTSIPGGPLAGNVTGVATPWEIAASIFDAMTRLGRAASLPGMAPLAPDGASPMGVLSSFRPAYSELLRSGSGAALGAVALAGVGGLVIITSAGVLSLSLAELAAIALSGVGGLVIITAAGVRIGYRQAKAGFVLQTAGIACFARPGGVPLGVVRSGSLVVVRPRALRVVRLGAFSAGGLLDKVA